MYVQSQGGAKASMGMQVIAKSTSYHSYMKFSCLSKYDYQLDLPASIS